MGLRTDRRRSWRSLLALMLLAGCLLPLAGCSGCRSDTAAEKKKEDEQKEKDKKDPKKKKPKPNFEFAKLRVLPGDHVNAVKPGHWMSVSQQMKANNFDFSGDLVSAAVDGMLRPLNLERTPYRLQLSRPASLPKGQAKHMEMTVFIPRRQDRSAPKAFVLARLTPRGGGRTVKESNNATAAMDNHEYYFVALARLPASYSYLKALDSVRPPRGDFGGPHVHYRVVMPELDKNVPLPSNPLLWTSIAYILWDDVDPDLLTLEQQESLVDWLHWGGTLIISGPGTLPALKTSFLADYLPAKGGKTVKLSPSAFVEMNEHFTLPGRGKQRIPLQITEQKPPEGIELVKHEHAQFVPKTGNLLVERQIGRGRLVVSSFALNNPQITNWSGSRNFDGFFNACLLRRPARKFRGGEIDGVEVRWADDRLEPLGNDARLTSGLRYFSRDMGYLRQVGMTAVRPPEPNPWEQPFPGDEPLGEEQARFELPGIPESAETSVVDAAWNLDDEPLFDRGFRTAPQSGVAGWNDFSGTSDAARRALKQAAGISVPERGFVLRVLAIYLAVLVPLNWGFFKLIGRVEWAWIAAPVIAVAGAAAVVRLAQLDIGFARSRTEVNVLELQGSHHRGHLTRYTALYTSLSTRYDATFDDPSALAQPFSTDPDYKKLRGQTSSTCSFRRDKEVSLRGFRVQSNSTGMLHSEQMFSIGGGLVLSGDDEAGYALTNNSDITLRDVGLLKRNGQSPGAQAIEVAWVGELKPKIKSRLQFGPISHGRALLQQWQDSPVMAANSITGELSLLRLLDLARDPRRMFAGDVRLIGWTDEEMPGMRISPRASQSVYRTLVVANLKYGALPPPQPDANSHEAAAQAVRPPLRRWQLAAGEWPRANRRARALGQRVRLRQAVADFAHDTTAGKPAR